MNHRTTERKTPSNRRFAVVRALTALLLGVSSIAFLPAALASASTSSRIGVFVDQPTTTVPSAPQTDAPAAPPTPATTSVPVTVPTTEPATTAKETTMSTLPDVLPPTRSTTDPSKDRSIVTVAKEFAGATKRAMKDVLSGKPVADVLNAVLPQSAADVVVPAVRTASTFVFPIGLAGAVLAFLALQQRIDAGDPKLTAAPLAHDDDEVEFL